MSRKDNKNRILRNGENQRKDGRYVYQYTDITGKRHSVYSWTLNPSDRTPPGKKPGKSLRELEDEIKNNGFNYCDFLVRDVVTSYCEEKVINLKPNTKHNYDVCYKAMSSQPFWNMKINTLNQVNGKKFLYDMLDSYGHTTVLKSKTILKNAFEPVVESELLKKNPFDFKFSNMQSKKRNALSKETVDSLLNFCLNNFYYIKWYYFIIILVNTGLRISEFLGLTFNDVDFEKKLIHINHQLLKTYNRNGKFIETNTIKVDPPKSQAGYRIIPMKPEVVEAFQWIIKHRPPVKTEYTVDGYSGFLILSKFGNPIFADGAYNSLMHLIKAYNKCHDEEIPKFSPHYFRHTFCTNLLESGMNPKSVQYLMGHSKIGVTLNVYAHTNSNTAIEEMKKLWEN